jgi:hypothetical protein
MTVLTVPVPPEEDASLRPVPWRRMAWVTWRQHRLALAGTAAFLGVLAVYLWAAGLGLHHAYAAAAGCHPAGSFACGDLVRSFNSMDGFLAPGYALQAVPALIGAFAGAPLLARELETGTFRYAWTQGFGRWRWTLAKLALLAVAVTAAAGVFSVLLSWYYQPYFGAGNQNLALYEASPLTGGLFDLRGVAFAAWTLAAVAIGALAGMLIRRVVPAIAATLAVYAGLAVAAGAYLRQHYLTPLVIRNLFPPGSAFMVGRWWTKGSLPVSQSVVSQVLQRAPLQAAGKGGGGVPQSIASVQYLNQHGYTQWISYQPASRFWPFQWIEGGWLLALSVLLIAATVWLVRRRAT